MRIFLMVIGWWAAGFLASQLVLKRLLLKIGDPCPKCPKCWLASLVSIAYGLGIYFFMPLLKSSYSSPEYLYSVLFAGVVAAAFSLAICPVPIGKS